MVYLNRIYTKSGDMGETSLGDGSRVPKSDSRIIAYGTVDELNAVIGVARAAGVPQQFDKWLKDIQNDLFDLGADLCVPETASKMERPPLRVTPAQVASLERRIDEIVETLQPLTSFVLPGGSPAAANLHHARTVCRRSEIAVLQLAQRDTINPQVVVYLNRLSDLLFVMARCCNHDGKDDVLWVPGGA